MSGRCGLVLAALLGASCYVGVNQPEPQPAPMIAAQPQPQPPPPTVMPPQYRVVQGPGFVLQVPAHWQEMQIGPPALVAFRDVTLVGNFPTTVNVVSEPFAGDGPGYASANIPLLSTRAVIIAQRPAVVGSLASTELESVWQAAVPPYRTLQRFASWNGRGYVVTCSGAHDTFESVRALCVSILDTFRVS